MNSNKKKPNIIQVIIEKISSESLLVRSNLKSLLNKLHKVNKPRSIFIEILLKIFSRSV